MPGRVVSVTGLGNLKDLEVSFRKAGLVVDETADSMVNSAKRAGMAAAEQAKLVGAAVDEQAATAGRAAAEYTQAQEQMTRAQKAAAAAAADAAKRMGLSADEQEAAAKRAADAADMSGGRISKAFEDGTTKAGSALTRLGKLGSSWGIPLAGSLEKMGHQFDQAESKSGKLESALASMGKVTLFAGAAGGAAIGYEAVKLGDEYETAAAKIQGSTGASKQQVESLTHAFGGTAGQFMDSGQKMETAYAGVADQLKITEGHILSNAQAVHFMTAAEQLNEATGGQLNATTGALSQTMMAFHLNAAQAAGTSDTLFNASRALNVPIESIATSAGRLHSRLGELAPSFGDITGLMVALGQHGVQGSRGLQVVNTAMQTLVGGSKKTDEVLGALGVHVFDQNGKFVGLQSVISQLQPKLAGLTEQQRLFAEQTLFGKGAAQVMGQVVEGGIPAFKHATEAATMMGTAHKAAAEQQHTLHGEAQQLKAALDTLGGDLGLVLIPKLREAAHDTAEVIAWMEKHKGVAEALGLTISGVLGVAVAVYAEQKAVRFIGATKEMVGDIKGLASTVEAGGAKMIGWFQAEDAAATESAGQISTSTTESSAAVEAEAAKMQMSFEEIDGGFVGTATAAGTAAGEIEASSAATASAVTAADSEIEAANATAGGSFSLLAGKIGLVGAAFVTAEAGAHGLGAALEGITGEKQAKSLGELIGGETLGEGPQHKNEIEAKLKQGAKNPKNWLGDAQYNHSLSGNVSPRKFAEAVLGSMGAPMTGSSLAAMEAWMAQEGGNWHNSARYNPLNTTYSLPGAGNTGSQGNIKAYTSWGQGLEATLKTLENPAYSSIVHLLQGGASVSSIEQAINSSPWGTHFSNAAGASHHASGHVNSSLQRMMSETATGKKKQTVAALGIPAGVTTMLATAQALLGAPYTHGGGHGSSWDPIEALKKIGVDCSGFVSRVLHSGGLSMPGPQTTAGLPPYLAKGHGRYVTVYDRPSGSQAHTLIEILGHMYESGGNSQFNPRGGVSVLTKAQAAGELAGGGFEAFHPTGALNTPARGGISEAVALRTSGVTVAEQIAASIAAQIKALESKGHSTLKTYQADIQTGSIKPLEKLLGYSSVHPSGQGSVAHSEFEHLVSALRAAHIAGLAELAGHLTVAHTEALRTLDTELRATQEKADARKLSLETVEMKDQTKIAEEMANRVVQEWKDATSVMVDQIENGTTALKDAGQSIADEFSAAATAIKDHTQEMTVATSAAVQQIQDKSQTEVDILGERGLYGLNLVAQQQQVQLDQMKTGYDQQIGQAEQAIARAQTETDNSSAVTQAMVDAVTSQQDALVGQAKSAIATTEQSQDAAIRSAEQKLDYTVKETDRTVQEAENQVARAATGTQAQQQAAQAHLEEAKANQAHFVAESEAALATAKNASAQAVQQAQNALSLAEANASKAEQEAQNALGAAKGHAEVVLAEANKILAEAQDKANIAEAEQQALIEKEKAEAQTQYAGSGLSINITGVNPTDSAAIASAVSWELKSLVPA